MDQGGEDSSGRAEAWPQYRKLPGGDRCYAIHSPRTFTELQRIGTRWLRYEVEATVYPEMLRIQEMLACSDPYQICDPSEWGWKEAQAQVK